MKIKRHHPRSIIQPENDPQCWLCGSYGPLETHHIFGGSNRKWSEEYGLKVRLCPDCHRIGPAAAHNCRDTADLLHRKGQEAFERTHTREEFMKIFGRNYL